MPRSLTSITNFLASPADVAHERDVISSAVQAWNVRPGRERGIQFDLLRWETNVAAGFSSDGQQVINEQIGLSYDALIAVFWGRAGSPTPRSMSGTSEEYERALAKRQAGEPVEIGFLFKTAAIPFVDIDPDQVKRVRDIKKEVGNTGAFYKEFVDDESLVFEVNLFLDTIARRLADTSSRPVQVPSLPSTQAPAESRRRPEPQANLPAEPDEPGLIDIQERLEQSQVEASAFLEEMTTILNSLAERTSAASRRLEDCSRFGPVLPNQSRPIIEEVCTSMNSFSDFLEDRTIGYSDNTVSIAESLRQLLDISEDFEAGDTEREEFIQTVEALISECESSTTSLLELRQSTSGLQRMTSSLNQAKRRLAHNLDHVISINNRLQSMLQQSLDDLRSN